MQLFKCSRETGCLENISKRDSDSEVQRVKRQFGKVLVEMTVFNDQEETSHVISRLKVSWNLPEHLIWVEE